jgi:hypothetical protein
MGDLFTEAQLKDIVMRRIMVDEGLGEHVGGSGHLGSVDAYIDKIENPEEMVHEGRKAWKVTYVYVKTITTEFTIYPDNPPIEYVNKQSVLISEEGELIQVLETENLQMDERYNSMDPAPLNEDDGESE